MQECLIRLWKLESEEPGRTRSWYLQNCRFHLQHWLASGKSLDSFKRARGDNRVAIELWDEELAAGGDPVAGELMEAVSARDIVSTLACHLKPCESALLGGLADGLVLNDIANQLNLSYPTALKYRRRIAAMTVKLGIPPPRTYHRDQQAVGESPANGRHRRPDRERRDSNHHHSSSNGFATARPTKPKLGVRSCATDFNPALLLATVPSNTPRSEKENRSFQESPT